MDSAQNVVGPASEGWFNPANSSMSLNQYQRRRNQILAFMLLKPVAQFPTVCFAMDELDCR